MMDENPPTEEEIADLLGQIQPQPRPGFLIKMSVKPWNQPRRTPFWGRVTTLRVAGTLGLVVLLLFGVSFLSPSLNTLAQRLSQFFFPSSSEQISPVINPDEIAYPLERFNLSIPAASELAGFPLKIPTTLPSDFEFNGAAYDEVRQAAIQNYSTSDGRLVLRITQQLLGRDYQRIGPAAVIEPIAIGKFEGEYVTGGWMIPVPEVKSGVETEATPITPSAVWDSDVNLQTLRWTDGEFLYEIMLAGGPEQPATLEKDDLVALATRLQ